VTEWTARSATDPVIEMRGIRRWFDRDLVLSGLDLHVAPGEAFALLGRNGAGKTTAIRILLGFLAAQGGRSRVLDEDSRELSPSTRERIGYVAEGHYLGGATNLEMLLDFEDASRKRFDRDLATKAIRRLDLPSSPRMSKLSRGQQAMLALILATSARPDVLIFDDPAMGLDVVMRRQLLEELIDLISGEGIALLFSSHILPDVERLASRVGILHRGSLVVDATMDELRGRFQRRLLRPKPDGIEPAALAARFPAIRSMKRRAGGVEITLVDLDPGEESRLRDSVAVLSEPEALNLEDLFVELTEKSMATTRTAQGDPR
jgi:ABC-2 type transport system ATP-binding protein